MMTFRILCASTILLVSCSSGSNSADKTASTTPQRKTMGQRWTEQSGFKQDKNGKWTARTDQRSPFESQGAANVGRKNFKTSEYKTGDFSKKSWWGNKEYSRPTYAGNTDGSRFQQTSRMQGQGAREASRAADLPGTYDTGTYATNAARETGRNGIKKTSNAIVDSQNAKFQQPEIIDWREQRKLSMEQSKGILGRH